jgi:peptide/nickel transport system substrate-binding protein
MKNNCLKPVWIKIRNWKGIICLLILMVSICGFLATTSFAAGKRGGTLKVAIPTDLTKVDLHKTTAQIDNWLLANTVYEKLFSYDANYQIKPFLCESYKISPDGKIYTLDLRKGVLFHNGSEMTAEDVKYSLDRARDKNLPSVLASFFGKIKDVIITGPYQVQLILSEPTNSLLYILSSQVGTMAIMPKKVLEANNNKVEKPIGTGPYEFVSWERDNKLTLKRFEKYTQAKGSIDGDLGKKPAYFDSIIFYVMKEPATRIMALERGDVDLVGFLPYQQIDDLKKKDGLTVLSELALDTRWNMFFLSFKHPLLSKVEFRRALALALDRNEVTKAAVWGYGKPSFSMILPQDQAYSPEIEKMMPYDPKKAKELLKEIGYRGESIKITCCKNYPQMYDQAVTAQAMWAAVGINTTIEVIDWTMVLERWKKCDHEILSFAMIGQSNPVRQTWALSTENYYGYKNPEIDKLREALDLERDQVKRSELYRKIQEIYIRDVPYLINFYIYTNYAFRKYIKGFEKFDLFATRWWNFYSDK